MPPNKPASTPKSVSGLAHSVSLTDHPRPEVGQTVHRHARTNQSRHVARHPTRRGADHFRRAVQRRNEHRDDAQASGTVTRHRLIQRTPLRGTLAVFGFACECGSSRMSIRSPGSNNGRVETPFRHGRGPLCGGRRMSAGARERAMCNDCVRQRGNDEAIKT
jgi:hypothetical protein